MGLRSWVYACETLACAFLKIYKHGAMHAAAFWNSLGLLLPSRMVLSLPSGFAGPLEHPPAGPSCFQEQALTAKNLSSRVGGVTALVEPKRRRGGSGLGSGPGSCGACRRARALSARRRGR